MRAANVAPGGTASIAALGVEHEVMTSACGPLKRPLTGNVRVMSGRIAGELASRRRSTTGRHRAGAGRCRRNAERRRWRHRRRWRVGRIVAAATTKTRATAPLRPRIRRRPGAAKRIARTVGGGRDGGGTAHRVDLGGILHQAHGIEFGAYVANRRRCSLAAAALAAHLVECGGDAASQPGRVRSNTREPPGQRSARRVPHRIQRTDYAASNPNVSRAPLGAMPKPVPDFALQVLLAAEQNRTGRSRTLRQRRPARRRVRESGQVLEVAVGPIGRKCRGCAFARAPWHHRNAAAGKPCVPPAPADAGAGRRMYARPSGMPCPSFDYSERNSGRGRPTAGECRRRPASVVQLARYAAARDCVLQQLARVLPESPRRKPPKSSAGKPR